MLHVKQFGTIGGAKILRAFYIRRLETGGNARNTDAIARKSMTYPPRLRWTARAMPQMKARPASFNTGRVRIEAHWLGLVGRAERKYDNEAETGYLGKTR